MSVRGLYPTASVLRDLRNFGKFQDERARVLFAKVQEMQDTGATMVMLSGDEYELLVALHIEAKQPIPDEEWKD